MNYPENTPTNRKSKTIRKKLRKNSKPKIRKGAEKNSEIKK